MSREPLHERVARVAGIGDARLLYGIVVPLAVAIVLIALWAWTGAEWLLPVVVFVVIVLTLIVIVGMYQVLSEDSDEEDEER